MTENDPSQALLFMGARQTITDLQHVVDAVEMVWEQGCEADIDEIWLHWQYTDRPLPVEIGSKVVASQLLTDDVCARLSQIELDRYDNVMPHLLSERETELKRTISYTRDAGIPPDQIQGGLADTISKMGGIAVISGTESAIHVLAGQYETLRQQHSP